MKASELRGKEIANLKQDLLELRKEQFNLRMQVKSGQNTNTALLAKLRKDVARVLTVINQKKIEGDNVV